MRRVALELYSQPYDLSEKIQRAGALDTELQQWFSQVPSHLKLDEADDSEPLRNPRRRAVYARKQSIVLRLREFLTTSPQGDHWALI